MNRTVRIVMAACCGLTFVGIELTGCKGAMDPWVQENSGLSRRTQSGAAAAGTQEGKTTAAGAPLAEPDFITVQHILIGYKGSVPGKKVARTKEEAETLAKEVLEMAKAEDADFDALVKKYTDDSHPGIYKMANTKVPPNTIPREVYLRKKMVSAFGDVGFPLQVGEVGLANYDVKTSPFGWHIIKRIE